jgi:hypothetical protein
MYTRDISMNAPFRMLHGIFFLPCDICDMSIYGIFDGLYGYVGIARYRYSQEISQVEDMIEMVIGLM